MNSITNSLPLPRHAYSGSNPVRLSTGPGRTKQSFKDECDINKIMARYQQTGVLDFANKHQASYADVSAIDFQSCMDQIGQAQAMFSDLPSRVRERFSNDPGRFLAFIDNPDNRPEMETLGLLKPQQGLSRPRGGVSDDASLPT